MEISVKRVKGYNCPSKHLLLIDGNPVIFANSEFRVREMISYIGGDSEINIRGAVKMLKPYRNQYAREVTA